MRARGEGSVYFSKSKGCWFARLTVEVPGGTTKPIHRRARSQAAANEYLAELRELYPHRRTGADPACTVGDYLITWLRDEVAHNRKPATVDSYERAVAKHIRPYLDRVRLRQLSPTDVRTWLATLAEAGVGDRTRQNAYAVLRVAMEDAVEMNAAAYNPVAKVKRPTNEREPIVPFTLEETRSILAEVEGHRLEAVFCLGLRCGLRQGEIFGARWKDIDGDQLHIRQQVREISGKALEQKSTKTEAGHRTVPLDEVTQRALDARRVFALKEGTIGEDLVFHSRKGTLMRRSNFGARIWKPLLDRLDLRRRGAHHMRHTYATLALASGVDLATVSRILGHSSPAFTAKVYTHWTAEAGRAAAESVSQLLG